MEGTVSILVAEHVTKRFGGLTAVDHLNVEIQEHSIHSIIGPNGAGKTTFFNCVSGFYRPEEGEILFQGRRIDGLSPDQITRRGISRTYQNIRLFSNMTAIENVLVGEHSRLSSGLVGAIFHTPHTVREEAQALEEAKRLLRFVGLAHEGDSLAKNLPYGIQRRLEIARALASQPRLMLLDEPTAGMNPSEAAQVIELIHEIRNLGVTVILIEHNMQVMMGTAEHIVAFGAGKKIAEGTPKEIQYNPQVIQAYLGEEE